MSDGRFDALPDGGAELEALLERSGVEYRREGARFRFLFSSRGCKWETVCDCREELVLVYGIHPGQVRDQQAALALCSQLTGQTVRGGFFLQEDHIVFRTRADLFDFCDAQEILTRALENNAHLHSNFWEQMSAGAEGLKEFGS